MWSMLLDRFTDLVFQLLLHGEGLYTKGGGWVQRVHVMRAPARIHETHPIWNLSPDFVCFFQCLFTLQSCFMRVARDEEAIVMLQSSRARLTWLCGLKFKSKTRIVWARLVNRYPNDSLTPFGSYTL